MASGAPPGLAGYLMAQESARRGEQANLQGLGAILSLQNAARQQALDEQMQPLKIEQLRTAVEQARSNTELRARLSGMLGGAAPAPGGAMPQAGGPAGIPLDGGMAPAGPADAAGPNPRGAFGGMNPLAAMLMMSGDAGLGKVGTAMQDANKPLTVGEGGSVFIPGVGQVYSRPKLGENVLPITDARGNVIGVRPMPGAAEAAGLVTSATEGAKAGWDPFMGQLDAQNRPIPQTRGQFVQGVGGAPAPQRASTPAAGPLNAGDVSAQINALFPLSAQAGLAAEGADIRRRELMPNGGGMLPTAQVFPQLAGRVPAASPPAAVQPVARTGMGQTPEERSAAETTGRETAQLVSGYRQKMPGINMTLQRLNRLEALNADDKTFAAGGAELKTELGRIAQGFGIDVAPFKTASSEVYLAQIGELMKDRLASKDYGSGSGVSNLDLIAARQPLPELAKTRAGRAEIINAIRLDTQQSQKDMSAAVQHFDKNLSLRDFQFPSAQTQSSQRAVTRRGTVNNRRVIQYSDGTIEYEQ